MSTASVEAPGPEYPNFVRVYGNDHSPWVQAVLLGLHEKGIPHTNVTVPPLSVFVDSGILMPAAKMGDGPWQLDSGRILAELGFSTVDDGDRKAMQSLFLAAALRRTDDPWQFWKRFSLVRDGHPSSVRRLWNQFWRAFSIFYFFVVIRVARRAFPRPDRERLVREFAQWQDRLAPGAEFLGGRVPDTLDLQLFGLIQMCASIPGTALEVTREATELERLRAWIERMQGRFSDYTHLYSARVFDPALPEIEAAPAIERLAYWIGAAWMWIALPITVPTVLFYARRVRSRNTDRN